MKRVIKPGKDFFWTSVLNAGNASIIISTAITAAIIAIKN